MVHWSGCTKHLSVGSSGQLTQHVLHWMSELHCSRHFFSTSAHVRGTLSIEVSAGLLEEAARHASGCRRTRRGLPELCVLNGTAVGGLDWELTVRKAAIRHQLTLINGVR